jgi:hypothetical protein
MRTLPCAVNSRRDSLGNYPRVAVDRAGQLVAEMEKAKGARGSGSNQHQVRSPQATAALRRLSDIGVSKQQSSDWQKLAAASFE